jgi:hypothetical protein
MNKFIAIPILIVLLVSEILIKTEGSGLIGVLFLIFISILGSIANKRFRRYAIVIVLGIVLSGPFIFVRNRVIGTLYSRQFEVLEECKSFEVLNSGWLFEYSWTHRYGYAYYALISVVDSINGFQSEVDSLFPNGEFRSADYISLFRKEPERYKYKSFISMQKAIESNDYIYSEIKMRKGTKEALEKANWIITFIDQGYYDLN